MACFFGRDGSILSSRYSSMASTISFFLELRSAPSNSSERAAMNCVVVMTSRSDVFSRDSILESISASVGRSAMVANKC
eukprot:scaffold1230_cov97-Skeletonema_dohrnii-CCMP3373.AAC.16